MQPIYDPGAGIAPPPDLLLPGAERVALGPAALFRRPGAGPAILCIPGGYHGAWCYADWLEAFAASGIAAAAVECRGKGTSDASPDPRTGIDDYAEDVIVATAALGGPVVLLGHSLGALVALRAVGRVPQAAGLLLIAPSPPGNLPGAAAVPLVAEGSPRAPPAEAVVVSRFLGGSQPAGLAAYLAALSPESPRALNERYGLRLSADPADVARLPVLVVEAGLDDHQRHPPGQDRALADFLGGAHLLLAEAPHCMMLRPWAATSAAPLIRWYQATFRGG
jgi:pimeloyl-ACP methyl ester carboxylesterase